MSRKPLLVTYDIDGTIIHESTWFGPESQSLFGLLSSPQSAGIKGGVILALPVGYEARGARIAMRTLASALAENGYVVLRFDYRGTGDSSGDFGSTLPNPGWIDDVASAVAYLRECGLSHVSAVGMRLGATLVGLAASRYALDLRSLVAWDPCESGRSFLRELSALETLRHEGDRSRDDGSVETAEYLFREDMVSSVRSLNLSQSTPATFAQKALFITREERPLSSSLRAHLETGKVDFETTSEQEALLDVYPADAMAPLHTISRIVSWISESSDVASVTPSLSFRTETLLNGASEEHTIVERAIRVGPRRLFAITSEPTGGSSSPWIVLLGGTHEDHTGPSRLWVELSRKWAAAGLRCVRIDLTDMGESPRHGDGQRLRGRNPVWIGDLKTIGPSLTADMPSNCVFVGFCSGAVLALEGAFGSGARGVCIVNLPSGVDYNRLISQLESGPSGTARLVARILDRQSITLPAVKEFIWLLCCTFLPRRWYTNITAEIVSRDTEVFALVGPSDAMIYGNVPMLRKFDDRLTRAVRPYVNTLVSSLDHDMTFAEGREDVARLLGDYVRFRFGSARPPLSGGDIDGQKNVTP